MDKRSLSRAERIVRARLTDMIAGGGITVQDVLAAESWGLLWSDVMDLIDGKPVSPIVIVAIDGAIGKIEVERNAGR